MVSNLRFYREQHEFTQEQLAASVGVSRQSIISIEKGQYTPTTILALKLSFVLKVKVEDLFQLEKQDWK